MLKLTINAYLLASWQHARVVRNVRPSTAATCQTTAMARREIARIKQVVSESFTH